MTELHITTLQVPGCRIEDENPLPMFRDRPVDRPVAVRDNMPEEKRKFLGWTAGNRVLPYRMQDRYTRRREPYNMRVAILENELLRATFWIELGGRLMSLVYKPLKRELLYQNPVFQPANLALRNAWFAGGIEWNVGQLGHTYHTCSPVFAAAIRDAAGSPGLRLYEYERCKGLLWHTDFYLPEASEFLVAFTRVINPQDEDTSMYWWTNMAVPELPGTRVLAPTEDAIYLDREIGHGFGFAQLPNLPSLPDLDPTYSLNWPRANEFFFQCERADIPWEAALDAAGTGLIEASTPRLMARKLFCWGTGHGGRHWQEYLAEPGMAYLEIQAGLAPTQLHHLPFAAGEAWHWTELFGYMAADPAQVHDPDYASAWRAVDVQLKRRITAAGLAEMEAACLARADQPAAELLQAGSGWGALECARRQKMAVKTEIPAGFSFPVETLGPDQADWLAVLNEARLPERPADETPGEYLVHPAWRSLLEQVLAIPAERSWYALNHYGVMLMEQMDAAGAEQAWRESLQKTPSAWASRNLAVLLQADGRLQEARAAYSAALELARSGGSVAEPIAYEMLALMHEMGDFEAAWQYLQSLPDDWLDSDRCQIMRARLALKIGQLDVVETTLQQEFATVREGQVDLTNLWFELWQQREAQARGCAPEEIALEGIKAAHPAPAAIDFRMEG